MPAAHKGIQRYAKLAPIWKCNLKKILNLEDRANPSPRNRKMKGTTHCSFHYSVVRELHHSYAKRLKVLNGKCVLSKLWWGLRTQDAAGEILHAVGKLFGWHLRLEKTSLQAQSCMLWDNSLVGMKDTTQTNSTKVLRKRRRENRSVLRREISIMLTTPSCI